MTPDVQQVLIICGPTATGKTALAAALAKQFDGELVSADSQQVYRGNDLETNKERPHVPIWLYDVVEQSEEFSVQRWIAFATEAISRIQARKKLPIVVGGTGFYIRALLNPISTMHIPPDASLRAKNLSVSELQRMVVRGQMNDSDWHNPRRLIRKVEIAQYERAHPDVLLQDAFQKRDVLTIGLTAPLPLLYARIDDGLAKRKAQGMKETGRNEHAIARKQLTWFRKQQGIQWFDVTKSSYHQMVTKKVAAWYTQGRGHED